MLKTALQILFVSLAAGSSAAQGGEEVPVSFDGDEEIVGEEQGAAEQRPAAEVLPAGPPPGEVERQGWTIAFPLACVLLLAWNVRWRRPSAEDP